jgi:hypothetical protein
VHPKEAVPSVAMDAVDAFGMCETSIANHYVSGFEAMSIETLSSHEVRDLYTY